MSHDLPLQKLPGLLDVTTTPVDGAKIMVDGAERGVSPAKDLEIDAGAREITVTSERYLPETRTLDIKGLGERQALAVALQPGWGTLSVTSAPAGALVRLDGAEAGRTPLSLEPLQGTHVLEFEKDGWKPARREIAIRAGTASALPTVALEKIDGTLESHAFSEAVAEAVQGSLHGVVEEVLDGLLHDAIVDAVGDAEDIVRKGLRSIL